MQRHYDIFREQGSTKWAQQKGIENRENRANTFGKETLYFGWNAILKHKKTMITTCIFLAISGNQNTDTSNSSKNNSK